MKSKKGISMIIATLLILFISITAVYTFNNWGLSMLTGLNANNEIESSKATSDDLSIDRIETNTIYITNKKDSNISINKLKIGSNECSYSGNATSGVNTIDISDCSPAYEEIDILIVSEQFVLKVDDYYVYS